MEPKPKSRLTVGETELGIAFPGMRKDVNAKPAGRNLHASAAPPIGASSEDDPPGFSSATRLSREPPWRQRKTRERDSSASAGIADKEPTSAQKRPKAHHRTDKTCQRQECFAGARGGHRPPRKMRRKRAMISRQGRDPIAPDPSQRKA